MVRIKVSVRLDLPIYQQLKAIAEELGWSFSDVIRYLLSVSYSVLRPDIKVSTVELVNFMMKESDEASMIETWKIIQFLVPRAIEEIERIEEELKKSKNQAKSE